MLNNIISKNIFLLLLIQVLLVPTCPLAETTNIGLNLTLSGVSAEVGQDCLRGHEIAKKIYAESLGEIKNIKFITEDNRSDPKVAIDAMRKLMETDKVSAIWTIRSPIGMALNPISKVKKIPLLGAIGHKDFVPLNEYAFQFWPTTKDEGTILSEYLVSKNFKTLSVLTTEDEWTKSLSKAVIDRFKELGGTVLFDESILPGESDVLSIMAKLKAKKAEAVFFNHTLGEVSVVLKKARQLGISGLIASNYWAGYPSVSKAVGGKEMEDIYFPELRLSSQKYNSAYKNAYNLESPGTMSYCCYIGTYSITQASKKLVSGEAKSMYEALNSLEIISLPDGDMKISGRMAQFPLAIKKISNGKVIEVE